MAHVLGLLVYPHSGVNARNGRWHPPTPPFCAPLVGLRLAMCLQIPSVHITPWLLFLWATCALLCNAECCLAMHSYPPALFDIAICTMCTKTVPACTKLSASGQLCLHTVRITMAVVWHCMSCTKSAQAQWCPVCGKKCMALRPCICIGFSLGGSNSQCCTGTLHCA